jgi:hypothetical protein
MRAFRLMLAALLLSCSTIAAAQDRPSDVPRSAPEPAAAPQLSAPEWGGADAIWVQMPASSFVPSSSFAYTTDNSGRGRRWQTDNVVGSFQAPIDVPQGAKITNLGVFYLDNNASHSVYGQFSECEYSGLPCVNYPSPGIGNLDCALDGYVCSGHANASPSGDGIYANLNAANIIVNNYTHRYFVTISLPTVASDGSMKIGGAVVGYRLQVSPAPAIATFPNDVPTNHPYFRFIEALADAGITAGCGPGSFCPNSPITRGEMAVFLAVALGLHWAPVIF